ncbi:MAG: hypothetical protein COA73_15025 [Candidatus Hydrogenedentota bacterium]|nr:MAG: hypothetical protein COA73_15025 [Candidatus Hydrogenedentota bacterium]
MSDFAPEEGNRVEPPRFPNTPANTFRLYNHPAIGIPLVVFGVLILIINGILEARNQQSQPWIDAVWSPDGEAIWDDTILVRSRSVPLDNFPILKREISDRREKVNGKEAEQLEALITNTGIEKTERVVFMDVPPDELDSLIVSGRLPEPGDPEVLAGVFARLDSFEMDETTFEVVGRLSPAVSGFHFAYILPESTSFESLFSEQEGVTHGWLAISGRDRLKEETAIKELMDEQDILGMRVPTTSRHAYASILGLMMVAVGGAIAHMTVFSILARRSGGIITVGVQAVLQQPRVLLGMHVVMFGTFFGMMMVGIQFPVPHLWLLNLITHEFTSGGLSYVGEAYASGRIFAAALATWFNNFIVQTVGMTFVISLIVPMVGLAKNLLSFAMVGFGMAPLWSGMSGMFSFHSITMTLELEAYIIACVIVVYFWRRVVAGLMEKDVIPQIRQGFRVMGSGVILTGVMLGVAGLYEAVTLILLR